MTWQFDSAIQMNDEILVQIVNVIDNEEVNRRTLTWTRSQGQPGDNVLSKTEFKTMIKSELKARLLELNTTPTQIDISSEIDPSNG